MLLVACCDDVVWGLGGAGKYVEFIEIHLKCTFITVGIK